MSPYQPPVHQDPRQEPAYAHRSVLPKVFGILHIVFGSIGVIWGAISMVMYLVASAALNGLQSELETSGAEGVNAMNNLTGWDFASTIFSFILGILLIVSGIGLVRYKKSGLKISNIYCVLSIIHKIGAGLILLLVKMPVISSAVKDAGGNTQGMEDTVMTTAIVVGGIMVLLMMIYPVLCLILLNKKQSQDSLS